MFPYSAKKSIISVTGPLLRLDVDDVILHRLLQSITLSVACGETRHCSRGVAPNTSQKKES